MRIAAGRLRGRPLKTPAGRKTRPTSARLRAALFDILIHRFGLRFEGAVVIDAFAGSGALGFEALSRGAARVLFLDTDEAARGAIAANAAAFGAERNVSVLRMDAARLGAPPADFPPASLALLDPPYGTGLAEAALAALGKPGWLAGGAIAAVELDKSEDFAAPAGYAAEFARAYGRTRFEILRFAPGAAQEGKRSAVP